MRADDTTYGTILRKLLPMGDAWATESGSVMAQVLDAMGGLLQQAHNRMMDLVQESDPHQTAELIYDWETHCSLPDTCAGQPATLAERRDNIVARLTARGGQSKAFYIQMARDLGFDITIQEHKPFRAHSQCTAAINPDPWRHVMFVDGPAQTVRCMGCGSACNDALRSWGNQALECHMRRTLPGHALVHFRYGGS